MKGKNVWTLRRYFNDNELDSMAEFLEDKIANGWEMTSLLGNAFGFRKAEPRRVKVSVELIEDADDESAKNEFISYCESDGWKHIFDAGRLQIFENENLDAEPIHTDEEVKLRLVYRKCRKQYIGLNVTLSVIVIALLIGMSSNLDSWDYLSCGMIVNLTMFPLGIAMLLYETVSFCLWYRRAKKAIALGEKPVYKRSKMEKIYERIGVIFCFSAIWLDDVLDALYSKSTALIALVLFFIIGFGGFLFLFNLYQAKKNTEHKRPIGAYLAASVLLVMVLVGTSYFVFLPMAEEEENTDVFLSVQELGVTSDGTTDAYAYYEGSPFAKHEYGKDRAGSKYIYYDLYTTKYQKIYDVFLEERFFDWDKTYEEIEDEAFGANKVYLMGQAAGLTEYLLLYDEEVFYLEINNIELNNEQKALIGDKVKAEVR